MSYESLRNLRYRKPDEWQAEYNRRYNSETAVLLNFSIHDKPAFYLETPELLKQIIKMQRIDKQIHELVIKLPGESVNQFTRRCLIDEIVITNNIEGVNSTRREIEDILSGLESKNKTKRFYGLVKKYCMLLLNDSISIGCSRDIRDIYNELVLPEVLSDSPEDAPDGEIFRKESVSVYSPTGKELHCGVNPESKIIEYMDNAIDFLNNSESEMLFKISVFHYIFGYIHPFYDGNGRTSRFISSYLLSKCFEPAIAFRLSYTIKENIKEYYESFKICNDRFNMGDITPFVYMFFDIIEKSLYQLNEALEKRYQMFKHYIGHIYLLPNFDTYGELYSLLIQAALFSERGISTKELIEILSVSRTTAANRLKAINSDLLNKDKIGIENYYSLNLQTFDGIIMKK